MLKLCRRTLPVPFKVTLNAMVQLPDASAVQFVKDVLRLVSKATFEEEPLLILKNELLSFKLTLVIKLFDDMLPIVMVAELILTLLEM